ncbi:hypothetical protein [Hyunsoonleella rubra]|uniref:Uncharacterized protein n=1 Tax=Hyunsoonleella rubra TaxID=1737062 RepID=A0ABW5TCG6_9FLAO
MKTKTRILALGSLLLIAFSFMSFTAEKSKANTSAHMLEQEGLIVYATYDGKEDYGYNFVTTDKNGEERTLTFQSIAEPALSLFDLNADTFVGTKFKVTFTRDIKVTKDENNMDDEEEINTITNLEKL